MDLTLRRMFDHMHWANARILTVLLDSGAEEGIPEKAIDLFAHILAAEQIWLSRIEGNADALPVWPKLGLEACVKLAQSNQAGYTRLMEEPGHRDSEGVITYRNSAGQPFENRLGDILSHVALHGSYHRGQIMALLKQSGWDAISTDYILYARQGN